MKDLANIKYWIFDLDNTLYEGDTKVFEQVSKRMSKYISAKLNINFIMNHPVEHVVSPGTDCPGFLRGAQYEFFF